MSFDSQRPNRVQPVLILTEYIPVNVALILGGQSIICTNTKHIILTYQIVASLPVEMSTTVHSVKSNNFLLHI